MYVVQKEKLMYVVIRLIFLGGSTQCLHKTQPPNNRVSIINCSFFMRWKMESIFRLAVASFENIIEKLLNLNRNHKLIVHPVYSAWLAV